MKASIDATSDVIRSPRVLQMEGMFDVPPSRRTQLHWDVDLPLETRPWQIGLVVGPSGSGKTTVARELWPDQFERRFDWDEQKSVLDDFPANMPIRDIIELLNSVGFSSPPAWVRPFRVLSTGEKFRVLVARTLAGELYCMHVDPDSMHVSTPMVVMDEFTSVVDRTVAQIGSCAIARTVRAHEGLQFVAVTCHYDVEAWLQPDWVYTPATSTFVWREVQDRPKLSSAFNESITPLGNCSVTITI